jgi:hypothetical protein
MSETLKPWYVDKERDWSEWQVWCGDEVVAELGTSKEALHAAEALCEAHNAAWNQRTQGDALKRIEQELTDLQNHDEMGGTARYLLSVLHGNTSTMRELTGVVPSQGDRDREAMDRLETKIQQILAEFAAETFDRAFIRIGPEERDGASRIMDAILNTEGEPTP